jgi:DnaJ-class molecular chaperone
MSHSIDFDPRVDYYRTLGVQPDASEDTIKRAYRKLAKKFHPDATGGDKHKEARFKEATKAYDVVGDQQKRAQYDAFRAGAPFGFGGGGGARADGTPFDFRGFSGGAGGGGFDLGSLFSQMFGQARGGGRPGRGARTHVRAGRSNGAAAYSEFTNGDFFQEPHAGPDPRAGTPDPVRERRIRTADGAELICRGSDIFSDVRLSIDEAILGADKPVSTLTGKAMVKIPPGTSSGKKLRLRGKGAAAPDQGRGDHYVTVHIDVPDKLDSKGRKALAELVKHIRK